MSGKQTSEQPDERLFDPATRAAIRAETQRPYAIAFGVTAFVIAGLVGGLHYEEIPFLAYLLDYCSPQAHRYECSYPMGLDWLAAGITFAFCGIALATVLRYRRIHPTVTCLLCDRRGWILDLDANAGNCPHCGHDRFRYRAIEGAGVPVVRVIDFDAIEGSQLLQLRRTENRL